MHDPADPRSEGRTSSRGALSGSRRLTQITRIRTDEAVSKLTNQALHYHSLVLICIVRVNLRLIFFLTSWRRVQLGEVAETWLR
jgi:hypothetical protein